MKKKEVYNKIHNYLKENKLVFKNDLNPVDLYAFLNEIRNDLSPKKKKKKVCKLKNEEYNKLDIDFKKKVYKCGKCGRVSNNKKTICEPYRYD